MLQDNNILVSAEITLAARSLNPYATLTRYPGYNATSEESESCLKYAKIILDFSLDCVQQINSTEIKHISLQHPKIASRRVLLWLVPVSLSFMRHYHKWKLR